MSRVVGIDLGTTNSLVAYVKDGVPTVIRDKSGDGLVPSVVSVAADGTVNVGREAQRRLLTDAQRTAYSVKRFMGKGREDVQDEARHFPFRIAGEAGPDHRKVFSVEVVVAGEVLGAATGRAKKEAEQEAARLALERLA